MHNYARQANSKSVKVQPAERPFSNFDFIDDRYCGLATLARLMSQARVQGLKTIVIEELKPSRDVNEEDEDLSKLTGNPVNSKTERLTFFANRFKKESRIKYANPEDILGYAILKRDEAAGDW